MSRANGRGPWSGGTPEALRREVRRALVVTIHPETGEALQAALLPLESFIGQAAAAAERREEPPGSGRLFWDPPRLTRRELSWWRPRAGGETAAAQEAPAEEGGLLLVAAVYPTGEVTQLALRDERDPDVALLLRAARRAAGRVWGEQGGGER